VMSNVRHRAAGGAAQAAQTAMAGALAGEGWQATVSAGRPGEGRRAKVDARRVGRRW
jgi:hypothetical protein